MRYGVYHARHYQHCSTIWAVRLLRRRKQALMTPAIQELYCKVLHESAERWNHPDAEKFARLIIEECANLFPKTFTDEQYQRRIDKTIRKHFGIIE